MKGIWKPYSNTISGKKMFIAGRILDTRIDLHSGNIESHGDYVFDEKECQALCDRLNEEVE